MSYVTARAAAPMRWLAAGLAADLAVYPSAHETLGQAGMWIALDLWLAYRVVRAGRLSLALLRGLLLAGMFAYAMVEAMSRWDHDIATTASPLSVVLSAVALWCLAAPALHRHVHPVRRLYAAA